MALGVIFMPMLMVKSFELLARFANPLVVLGQIFIYFGIMQFLDKKENKRILGLIFAVFVICYYYFMYIDISLSARTVAINAAIALISIMTAVSLFYKKDSGLSSSLNFTAGVFFLYGCFVTARALFALLLPPMQTYSDQWTILIIGFIVPIIASTLWTYGFIIMLNQRLNIENFQEKEKIQQLVEELETERNIAQLNSITDSLTGLANRRYFDDVLRKEFYRSKRSGAVLSLIMLDVDYFKKFNDTYGHPAGDDCLRKIGNILQNTTNRVPDIAFRYGGEEFVMILPETEEEGAKILAEQIVQAVQVLAIPHSESDVSQYVTVSIGIVSVSAADSESPERVISLVDEAMYFAKNGGRNRIEVIYNDTKNVVDVYS